MTLTRATLGTLAKRATKDIEVCGHGVRIQKPTPLEFSQYQASLVDKEGRAVVGNFAEAILLLVARMWIDGDGERLFKDSETKQLGSIDLTFYQRLSEQCQMFARGEEAEELLGESEETTDSGSPVESA